MQKHLENFEIVSESASETSPKASRKPTCDIVNDDGHRRIPDVARNQAAKSFLASLESVCGESGLAFLVF